MSPLRLIILLVAAGAAIAAVFLVRSVQTPAKASAAAAPIEVKHVEEPKKQVLVARKDIVLGHFLAADDLGWQAWPENSPTKSFIEKKDAGDALEKSVGAVAPCVTQQNLTAGCSVRHARSDSSSAALLAAYAPNPG